MIMPKMMATGLAAVLANVRGGYPSKKLDMQPILHTMMKPVLDNKIRFRVNSLCKMAEMEDMRNLPQCNNNSDGCWDYAKMEKPTSKGTNCVRRTHTPHQRRLLITMRHRW